MVGDDEHAGDNFKDGRSSDDIVGGTETAAGRTGGIIDKMINKKSDIKRAFRQTALVKELRTYKENEKKRRSMLIYGTTDMKAKIHEKNNIESKKNKRKGNQKN